MSLSTSNRNVETWVITLRYFCNPNSTCECIGVPVFRIASPKFQKQKFQNFRIIIFSDPRVHHQISVFKPYKIWDKWLRRHKDMPSIKVSIIEVIQKRT